MVIFVFSYIAVVDGDGGFFGQNLFIFQFSNQRSNSQSQKYIQKNENLKLRMNQKLQLNDALRAMFASKKTG